LISSNLLRFEIHQKANNCRDTCWYN
jgi:hypothetical protein